MLLVTYLLVICSYPSITFLGGCTLLLVYNWLLVICSYAGTNFSVLFLALRGQPPRRLFVLTWLRLPGFYLFIGLFLFYFGCLSYVVMQAPFFISFTGIGKPAHPSPLCLYKVFVCRVVFIHRFISVHNLVASHM